MFHLLLSALLLLSGPLPLFRPVAGQTSTPREVRALPDFTRVLLGTSASVVVRQGSPQRVEIEATPEELAGLKTSVRNGQLVIETQRESNQKALWQNSPSLRTATVYVTLPVVSGLAVSSSGTLRADSCQALGELRLAVSSSGRLLVGAVRAPRVRAAVSSSGTLRIGQLRADTLRAALSSSGSIVVAGACRRAAVAISSSGHVDASALSAETGEVCLSSSGGCQVSVLRTLDACLSGSGGVSVSSNPQITSRISGSGRVRRG